MKYIDFHTHHPAREGCFALQQDVLTQGVHPWNATLESLAFVPLRDVWAIGESGLDKLCSTPMDVQQIVFLHQVALSEELAVPLLIHCVKAIDEVVTLRKRTGAKQPWIFHGFRGKPQQLRTLLDAGFFVSFGPYFNTESLCLCPLDRMLLETDDADLDIVLHYRRVAEFRGITEAQLLEQMWSNAHRLFKSFGEY